MTITNFLKDYKQFLAPSLTMLLLRKEKDDNKNIEVYDMTDIIDIAETSEKDITHTYYGYDGDFIKRTTDPIEHSL